MDLHFLTYQKSMIILFFYSSDLGIELNSSLEHFKKYFHIFLRSILLMGYSMVLLFDFHGKWVPKWSGVTLALAVFDDLFAILFSTLILYCILVAIWLTLASFWLL